MSFEAKNWSIGYTAFKSLFRDDMRRPQTVLSWRPLHLTCRRTTNCHPLPRPLLRPATMFCFLTTGKKGDQGWAAFLSSDSQMHATLIPDPEFMLRHPATTFRASTLSQSGSSNWIFLALAQCECLLRLSLFPENTHAGAGVGVLELRGSW